MEDGVFGKISDFRYIRTVDGKDEFVVEADTAVYFDEKQKARIRDAKITVFTDDGKKIYMTADQGIVYLKNQQIAPSITELTKEETQKKPEEEEDKPQHFQVDIEASGNILIRFGTGVTVTTEKLRYDGTANIITSDQRVLVASDYMTMAGTGLLVELDKQKLVLEKDVKTRIVGSMFEFE